MGEWGSVVGAVSIEIITRCFLFVLCLFVTWTDLQERRIPNWSLLLCMIILFVMHFFFGQPWSWLYSLLIATVVLFSFAALAWRWPEALGMGDVKLFACLTYGLGGAAFVWIVTAASLLALLYASVVFLVKRKKAPRQLPFAPFLFTGYACWLSVGAASW